MTALSDINQVLYKPALKPGYCKDKCYRLDFSIPILFKQPYTFWSSHQNKYRTAKQEVDKQGRPARVRRYDTKLKKLGLAKCKVCVYITARPTKPGTKCPCCKHQLSQSIRDISNTVRRMQDQENNP